MKPFEKSYQFSVEKKIAREIFFHKYRYLLIFAVITQLVSPLAHSAETGALDLPTVSIHLRASRRIKKYIIFGKKILNMIMFLFLTSRSNKCYKSHH